MYVIDAPTVATWAFAKAEPYGIDTLSLSDLGLFGWNIQKECNERGVNVLVNRDPQDFKDMTVQWYDEHHPYFILSTRDNHSYVRRAANLAILKDRFTPPMNVARVIMAVPFTPEDIPRDIGCRGCAHNLDGGPHSHDITCQGCCRNTPDRYTPREVGE